MSAAIRIPNAIAPLEITADLRAGKISCHFDIDAPREGKPTTRVNWALRQLREAPDTVRIEVFTKGSRVGTAELLRDVRDAPAKLVADPTKEIRAFRLAQLHPLGTKRSGIRGSFIDSMLHAIDTTYGDVGQKLKAWSAAPPRLRSNDEVEVDSSVDEALPSNALSSQDE